MTIASIGQCVVRYKWVKGDKTGSRGSSAVLSMWLRLALGADVVILRRLRKKSRGFEKSIDDAGVEQSVMMLVGGDKKRGKELTSRFRLRNVDPCYFNGVE